MKIDYKTIDIEFSLDLQDRVCVLYTDSGEGKTFLFNTLKDACTEPWHSNYVYINYSNYQSCILSKELLNKSDAIIVLDNADLYKEKLQSILYNSSATIIVVIKDIIPAISENEFHLYKIIHKDNKVHMMRS